MGQLLEYYPFRHELRPKSQAIGTLKLDIVATVVGELRRVRKKPSAAGPMVVAQIVDGTGTCNVRWFHSPFLDGKLRDGLVVRATGQIKLRGFVASITNPRIEILEPGNGPFHGDSDVYEPIYPATSRLSSRQIAFAMAQVLERAVGLVPEILPEALRTRRALPPRQTAILRFHRPTRPEDVAVARERLAYDELLLCQLSVLMARNRRSQSTTEPISITPEIDRRIRARLPFTLTPGQNSAIEDIRTDLIGTRPMNRLLQADVGAGKTAVAVYAALATVACKRQVALLAPTEVLAAQHHAKIGQYLAGSRVRHGFLAGSTSKSQRAGMLRELAAGRLDWLVGTHALLEKNVEFGKLGLAIIDEQHKFGVAQRAALRQKGIEPHVLVLTATPIPRTLAMTIFGELDVSVMRGALPGRKPVVTRIVAPEQVQTAWAFVRSRLESGEQAYVVYPLVEESEVLQLKAAESELKRLADGMLNPFTVGLLHGRMAAQEKADIMSRFANGRIHALVSTTVVEVGIDVPNATIMVVQHPERFGLSQLHQLRGRVGRAGKKSYCLLMAENAGDVANERLSVLCQTNDGFDIAEEDLRIRGPGDLLGLRQHGLPLFRVADLRTDLTILEQAREDAKSILKFDPQLTHESHSELQRALNPPSRGGTADSTPREFC